MFRYRGYRGILSLFHRVSLPTEKVTHFVIGQAIVGLHLANEYYIISKHNIERKRLLFVQNTGDEESIYVCDGFWGNIKR